MFENETDRFLVTVQKRIAKQRAQSLHVNQSKSPSLPTKLQKQSGPEDSSTQPPPASKKNKLQLQLPNQPNSKLTIPKGQSDSQMRQPTQFVTAAGRAECWFERATTFSNSTYKISSSNVRF